MKKIFTLIAVAAMAISASAQDFKASDYSSLPKGTKILDNAYVTIVTGVQDTAPAEIKDQSEAPDPKTYGGFTFTHYVNIRVADAPAEANNWEGTAQDGVTPAGISLIVTVKQHTDMTLYYKHGNGKAVSCIDQTTGKNVSINETSVEGISQYYTGVYQFISGHTYTIYAKGGTTGLNGISTAVGTYVEPVAPQDITGAEVKTTWVMNDPDAISSTTDIASAITDTKVTLGDGLSYQGSVANGGTTFTKLQPTIEDKGKNEYANAKSLNKYIDFQVTPNGNYQITKVEFDIIKIGTGDPNIYVDLINADGTANTIGDDVVIRKSSETTPDTHQAIEGKTVASDQPVSLRIYIGKLANNKQVAIANVVITGISATASGIQTVKADAVNAPAYNLAGQKVSEGYKGVVIQNGKKVVMK